MVVLAEIVVWLVLVLAIKLMFVCDRELGFGWLGLTARDFSEPRFEFCGRFRSVGFMLSSLD